VLGACCATALAQQKMIGNGTALARAIRAARRARFCIL
jgi:hypothetical protein